MKLIEICDECESGYFKSTSKMNNLSPNCAYLENCNHMFQNGRYIHCFWDENLNDYLTEKTSIKSKKLNL